MYTIADYGAMIADRVRTDAFRRALAATIKPGSIVLDIGTGTGIFALMACRLGARRVYAVEPADAIQVAREIAAANGYADRIEFIQARSTVVTLPERADVIVSDLGGVLPWFQQHIPSLVDARERLLAPGGVLIPARDTGWAAVIKDAELYERHTRPWDDDTYGFDMQAAREMVINTWRRTRVVRTQLLSNVQRWATIDYARVTDANVNAELSFAVTSAGTGHGVALGFDRTLAEGIEISNAPDAPANGQPSEIYGTAFFPWTRPVQLDAGDTVFISVQAHLLQDDYVWSWTTRIEAAEPPHPVKASYAQSTFYSAPVAPATLRRRASSHTPELSDDGALAHFVLDQMTRRAVLGDIANVVHAAYPRRFSRLEDALAYVGDLSVRFGR